MVAEGYFGQTESAQDSGPVRAQHRRLAQAVVPPVAWVAALAAAPASWVVRLVRLVAQVSSRAAEPVVELAVVEHPH